MTQALGVSAPLATSLFSVVPGPDGKSLDVSFTVNHRLHGHTVEVETEDTRMNQGRYILYPQGGHF